MAFARNARPVRLVVVLAFLVVALVFTRPGADDAFGKAAARLKPDNHGRLYACVTRRHRTLNLTTRARGCPRFQREVVWKVAGPRGKKGRRGRNGQRGPAGPAGPRGQAGSQGPTGPQGQTGPTGPAGASDTPQQILDKLKQVDGSGSGLDADLLDGLHSTGFWQLGGNAGTDPSADFLGTTDNQPLNLRVDNQRALRLEPALSGTAPAPNVIGGSPDNSVAAGIHSATIAGGGRLTSADPTTANSVIADGGTVGGGLDNHTSAVSSTVAGGQSNTASGIVSAIGGGVGNTASATDASVGGGATNTASGIGAAVGGGTLNIAVGPFANVSGGAGNTASGASSTVSGGSTNKANGNSASIGGGISNTGSGQQSNVSGGNTNLASGNLSTVGGGSSNTASGGISAIGGGISNVAPGNGAVVAGGANNTAAGDFSLVAGQRAKNTDPTHDGVFLFADTTAADFASTAANEFAVRASGGVRLRTSADLSTGCDLPAGSGTFSCTSDRNAKRDFEPVDGATVLDRLVEIPITTWSFKADPVATRHIGPMAQDFHGAFGVGADDRTISTVDADGVALAAIKALAAQNREQAGQIAALQRRLAELEGGGG